MGTLPQRRTEEQEDSKHTESAFAKIRANYEAQSSNLQHPPAHSTPAPTNTLAAALSAQPSNELREDTVLRYACECIGHSDFQALFNLLSTLQDAWPGLTVARLTKIVRRVFHHTPVSHATADGILALLDSLIAWAEPKKMLRIDLLCKQIHVLLNVGRYSECLERVTSLLPVLKRYDDRLALIAVHVYESRAHYELKDMGRARSALTAARALAVRSACPAYLQAQIDMLNGMYLGDERAYDTALSYFTEAAEGFAQDKMPENTRVVLRYIVLSKIMAGRHAEIPAALAAKYAVPLVDDDFLRLLQEVSAACKERDLQRYNEALRRNAELAHSDPYILRHLQALYDTLLEENIKKFVEPFARVKVLFLAARLGLPADAVEDKLRRMILDGALHGILDHITQCLVVFPEREEQRAKESETIQPLLEYFTK